MNNLSHANPRFCARLDFTERRLYHRRDVDREEPPEVNIMAFIVTGLYVLALFSAGVVFVRRGKKEKQEKEEHCAMPTPASSGADRRSGTDRRNAIDRRVAALTR